MPRIRSCCHLYEKMIKIYHVVQELCVFSLTDHRQTDSNCNYSADPRVLQYCSADQRVEKDLHIIYNADARVVEYSADLRVMQFYSDKQTKDLAI